MHTTTRDVRYMYIEPTIRIITHTPWTSWTPKVECVWDAQWCGKMLGDSVASHWSVCISNHHLKTNACLLLLLLFNIIALPAYHWILCYANWLNFVQINAIQFDLLFCVVLAQFLFWDSFDYFYGETKKNKKFCRIKDARNNQGQETGNVKNLIVCYEITPFFITSKDLYDDESTQTYISFFPYYNQKRRKKIVRAEFMKVLFCSFRRNEWEKEWILCWASVYNMVFAFFFSIRKSVLFVSYRYVLRHLIILSDF